MSDSKVVPVDVAAQRAERKRTRVPMSVPSRKLEVPDRDGYHRHWFVERNIERALAAGYEFVNKKDVRVNQLGVATSKEISGNADLGSHVRVVAGVAEGGATDYLTLMEIPLEWWQEDQRTLEKRNESVITSIFRDEQIVGTDKVAPEDRNQSYVSKALFNRPSRKKVT